MKFRNPLIQRGGPPVALNERAARWGAIAVLIGALLLAQPFYAGWSDAQARLEAEPAICGTEPRFEIRIGEEASLHQKIVSYFIETCEVPR